MSCLDGVWNLVVDVKGWEVCRQAFIIRTGDRRWPKMETGPPRAESPQDFLAHGHSQKVHDDP